MQSCMVSLYFYYLINSLTCDGGTNTNCLSCNTTDTYRVDDHTNNKCPCDNRYYDDGNNEVC